MLPLLPEPARRWAEILRNRLTLTDEESRRIDGSPVHLNSAGFDDWGLDPTMVKSALGVGKWLYKNYFRVKTHGIERVPQGRVLVIANHGGQLPVDGLLLYMSLALEANPARIARPMVERWVPTIPFISTLFARCGVMVGDPHNCKDLLETDECVIAFPEGVRGSGKPFAKRYQLQRFGTGFVRLALETRTPILPVGIVGCEEIYPAIANFAPLAKLLRMPYFPITPLFPALGVLGAVPLPSQVNIRFGEPLTFDANPDASDAEIEALVEKVKAAIRIEIDAGLAERGR